MPFGSEVRRRRRAQGLTLEQLAERSGLSPNYIASLETDPRRDPSVSTVSKLAKGLGVHLVELLGGSAAGGLSPEGREVAGLLTELSPETRKAFLQLLHSLPRRGRRQR